MIFLHHTIFDYDNFSMNLTFSIIKYDNNVIFQYTTRVGRVTLSPGPLTQVEYAECGI